MDIEPTSPPMMPVAGWYPDPEQSWSWRWWDGSRWTDLRAPMVGARPGRNPHSVSAWFDDSLTAVKAVVLRVGLLVALANVAVAVLFAAFAVGVWASGRGREIRSLLELDDVFTGRTDTIEVTDAEWERAGDLAGDILRSAIPWMVALGVITAAAIVWTSVITARVAGRTDTSTVNEVSRLDDTADAVRRIPAVIGAIVVLTLVFSGIFLVALLPLGLLLLVDAGGAAIAVAAVFGLLAAIGLFSWVFVRLALAVVLASLGGHGIGIRRSWEITDDRYWATLGRLMLASLVAGAATVPLSFFNSFGLSFGFATWLASLLVLQTVASIANTLVTMPAQVVLARHLTEQHRPLA